MTQKHEHSIHYINTCGISNSYKDFLEKPKHMTHRRTNLLVLNKSPFPTMNFIRRIDSQKYSFSEIKNKLSKMNFFKNLNNTNRNRKKHTYHTIFYSKINLERLNRNSNSVNKLIPYKYINNYATPKKKKNSNLKIIMERRSYSLQRCMTVSNSNKTLSDENSKIKIPNEKKIHKKDLKKINIFEKLKNQLKNNNQIKIIRADLKNPKKEINNKNKNRTEKNKKIARKLKGDLIKPVTGLQSKEERLRNLLYGIPYMKEIKKCDLCHKLVQRYNYKFHYYSHPTPILNWLFLGTLKNGNNIEEIKLLGIKNILNCANDVQCKNIPKSIKYCQINLTDSPTIDITKFFDEAFSFIENARKKNEKILLHCKLGVSRSPAILMGYLIKYMGYTTESALDFLQSKRSQVYPNSGFIEQLYEYEKKVKKNQKKNICPINNITSNSTVDLSII